MPSRIRNWLNEAVAASKGEPDSRDQLLALEYNIHDVLRFLASLCFERCAEPVRQDLEETPKGRLLVRYAQNSFGRLEKNKCPSVSIGTHYRGNAAIAGRRSLFTSGEDFLRRVGLGPNDGVLLDAWHDVMLQSYFELFGRENTINEWVAAKLKIEG